MKVFGNLLDGILEVVLIKLFYKQDLTTNDTREGFREFPVIPFADELGAYYYALRHNYKVGRTPLVIKIKLDLQRKYVYVDGRDFLYAVFGLWDGGKLIKKYGVQKAFEVVKSILEKVYGSKIIKYFQEAAKSKNSSYRVAMCDLAVHDIEVVEDHLKNEIVIEGRCGVVFRSAFFVEAPVAPEDIEDIFIPESDKYEFDPEIQIYGWL